MYLYTRINALEIKNKDLPIDLFGIFVQEEYLSLAKKIVSYFI